jgi:hypothetical protein
MVLATASDHFFHRYFFIFASCMSTIIGFILIMTTHSHPGAQYGALFLIVSGFIPFIPRSLSFFS